MKSLLILALTLIIGQTAQASFTTCAGPTLYYSNTRADMGMQPPPGTLIGTTVIVFDGKLKLKRDSFSGLGIHSPAKFYVDLIDATPKVLEKTGNMVSGQSINKNLAVLYKVNPSNPAKATELAREEVVCQQTWAMVP